MIKNKFKKTVLMSVLLSVSLMAQNSYKLSSDTNSLIAIEGGYSRINSEFNNLATSSYSQNGSDLYNIGLKIGAETEDYRAFLSLNYYNDNSNTYDYIATYGVAFEYKFNISSETNMFVGLNGGIANMKFLLSAENVPRTLSNPYLGGEAGFNFAMSKVTDFEVGARYINIQAVNTKNNQKYILNDMLSYYMSFIFKFKMD